MFHKTEFSISIDHHLKIVKYKHTGIITKRDLDDAWGKLVQLNEFAHLKYNLLADYRNSRFDISHSTIEVIVNEMKSIKSFFEGRRQSFIIDDPFSMAISMLFIEEVKSKIGFKIDVFSTEEAATAWLIF